MVTRQIRVMGRVQGVGYRDALRREAHRHGVAGWVRNRADGSVQALLQGQLAALDEVVDWARRGPPGSQVAALRTEPLVAELDRDYQGFEIWPTL
jgi:acylphosphatase